MSQDPGVMRYFPSTLTDEQCEASFNRAVGHQQEHGYCFWTSVLRETGEYAGFIGIQNTWFEADFTPCVEIGWRLVKKHWNKGLATEGAIACLEWAWHHGINEIYSFTPLQNIPSQRVMQKIGMEQVGTFMHPKLEEDSPLREHVLYRVNNE